VTAVLLDGENVTFAGPPPASVAAVRELFEQSLAAQGRVLAVLAVDGQPFDENLGNRPLSGVARVEGRSVAVGEALAAISAELRPELAALERELRRFASEVLRAPWPETHATGMRHLEGAAALLQRCVDVASLTGEDSPATGAVAALAAAVEPWMAAVQAGDAARVALLLDGAVAPAVADVAHALPGAPAP
jgi:hypothetical protein